MGIYFNPNNESFTKDRNYKIYIDKTGLLEYLNESVGTPKNCIALSHARRFGKSHAAGMIDAYYSLGCDSTKLFEDTEIAENSDFKKYMNKYNVIHLDISSVWDFHKEDLVESIHERVCEDFQKEYADTLNYDKDLYLLIQDIYSKTNVPFVIIIDEWDCVIRNSNDKELVHKYLQFLHSLFKSEESKSFLALAYITGILPIKKIFVSTLPVKGMQTLYSDREPMQAGDRRWWWSLSIISQRIQRLSRLRRRDIREHYHVIVIRFYWLELTMTQKGKIRSTIPV